MHLEVKLGEEKRKQKLSDYTLWIVFSTKDTNLKENILKIRVYFAMLYNLQLFKITDTNKEPKRHWTINLSKVKKKKKYSIYEHLPTKLANLWGTV